MLVKITCKFRKKKRPDKVFNTFYLRKKNVFNSIVGV